MFYLFHHIPKTAGTSCLEAFKTIFKLVRDYHKNTTPEELANYNSRKINLSKLGEKDILCGHWNISGYYLYERYPDLDQYNARKIIFFRDPLETAKSGVRFGIKRGWYQDGNLDYLLLKRVNYFSNMLQCDNSNYRKILDSYWFVGMTDDLQKSFDRMASMLQVDSAKIPFTNTSSEIKIRFSPQMIDEFYEKNSLDFEIYRYAKTIAGD